MSSARDTRRLASASAWLALSLVAIKAAYLYGRGISPREGTDWLRALAAISYADVSFAAALWAIARVLTALAPPARRHRLPMVILIGGAAAVAYAVVNVALFPAFGGFVTTSLLVLLPEVPFLRATAASHLSAAVLAWAVVAAAAYVILAEGSVRARAPEEWHHGRFARASGAVVLLAFVWWTWAGSIEYREYWSGRQDRRSAESPHWLVLQSAWRAATRGIVRPEGAVAEDELREFRGGDTAANLASARAPRPNVILIVLESVGARWSSLYGGPYDSTPTLARVSQSAVVFNDFYAHIGRSSNALVAMLMSRYPRLDFRDITDEYPQLPGTTLASVLHDRGYETAYATSSDFAWAGWKRFLTGRGFDELTDYHSLDCPAPLSEWGVEDRCLVDAMIAYVERERSRPFFLMAWTTQTHYPYEPTPGVPMLDMAREPGPDNWDLGRYLNVLHETDRHLGRLFDALGRAGLDRRTIVAVVGDHGQAFGYPHDSYGQGRTAYEEDVHVPLMIRVPGFEEGVRSNVIGSQVDLSPTLAALAGAPAAPDWQGRNLLDPSHLSQAYFYVAEDHFTLGVRETRWAYLWDLREGTEELYDLDRDPNQQHSVAAAEPDVSASLRRRLAAWLEANRRQYLTGQ